MNIVENKALQIRTRNPDKFKIIPKHHVQEIDGGYEVTVFWGLDEARVLKNLGVKNVPSPIQRNYKWPGRYKPMGHQMTTAGFLTMHRRAFVFNDPGTAKTIAALWAADYLMKRGEVRRVLIICPLSIMQSAWMGDIMNSIMHRSAVVAHHTQASRRIEMIQDDYEFVIINYDGLNLVADEIKADGRFDLVIVDEANAYAVPSTKRWKSLARILTPNTFLWMMTGTPAAQSPVNAYGLAKLVNPSGVPQYATAWRDKVMNKITTFKWAPKPNAKDLVFAALQPAIRFAKKDCLDLPPVLKTTREVPLTPMQKKYYDKIKNDMLVIAAGQTISAVNKAAVVNKLLQISCIAYNTPVLTDAGWLPIQDVRLHHTVWDGVEFVRHEGLLARDTKPVVQLDGVMLTEDHFVMTASGWHTVKEIHDGGQGIEFSRPTVRLPDGAATRGGIWRNNKESAVAMSLCLRNGGCTGESIPTNKAPAGTTSLWVPTPEHNARYVEVTPVQHMGKNEKPLPAPGGQRLAQLWGAWNKGMQRVGRLFCRVLERHEVWVRRITDVGAQGRKQRVQQEELHVGILNGASEQHTLQSGTGHPARAHDSIPCSTGIWTEESNAVCPSQSRVAGGSRAATTHAKTYDIYNCGPRNRFVVQGKDGQLLVVHNCGGVYTEDHDVVEFDATPRMNLLLEILEETDKKVIIFAMFRSSIDTITAFLTKHGISVDTIHGGVAANKRGDIINRFQNTSSPRVLVMQPQATAHGITLTAADTVVFFGPLMSVELYTQAIARADRKGQVSDKVTVVHIQSSPIEKKMFAAMDARVTDHTLLTEMFDEEMGVNK